MKVKNIDHLVLTVTDIERTINFYQNVFGMDTITFGENRQALTFGHQKINLHQHGSEFEPKAQKVQPGSADLCFLTDTPIEQVVQHLNQQDIPILEGPVERTGATGKILSIYCRDPDGNLLEVSNLLPEGAK